MPNTLALARFKKNRMSQRETAKRADIPDFRYWAIENDLKQPTAEERARLASVLDVDVATLFPPAADVEGVPV